MNLDKDEIYDCIIIGGGQSALACAYYLRKTDLNYIIIDKNKSCGGSWSFAWDSLNLFSPAEFNLLPGWPMPKTRGEYPTRDEMISYLCAYEDRYDFPIHRNITVDSTHHDGKIFELNTSGGILRSKALISATGTYEKLFIPQLPGLEKFEGEQFHSAEYKSPEPFDGKKVLVVGEGNSGAQILADLYEIANCFWAVKESPEFLPPEVDGRYLFDAATQIYQAKKEGKQAESSKINLGNIVRMPRIKEAEEKGVFKDFHQIDSFFEKGVKWEDGSQDAIDVIIWCTGFGYATQHLSPAASPDQKGKLKVENNQSLELDGLFLVGYGNWTGFASATVIGVGRTAKSVVKDVEQFVKDKSI